MTTTITSTSVTTVFGDSTITVEDDLNGQFFAEVRHGDVLIGALRRDSYTAAALDSGYALGVWLRQIKEGVR